MSTQHINLVILRHGEADNAVPDRRRRLTEFGKKQIIQQCLWLKNKGFNPDIILHSPYLRTTETAKLAKATFSSATLQVEPLITPDGDPEMAASLIPALGKGQVLVASHMPMVTYLTESFLSTGNLFSYPVAGLCWLEIPIPSAGLKLNEESLSTTLVHKHWPS